MGRASSTKKVSRAASTGGGRTARGAKPWLWYGAMGFVVLVGSLGIVLSREQRRDALAEPEPPLVGRDHWHAAYGVYLCDEFAAPIQDERDPKGIHTHADGIIHIHPFVRSAAGRNATLGVFADAAGLTLTDSEVKLPGGESHREGRTKCDGKDGIVQVKVNDQVLTRDVSDVRLRDRDIITIAFAPEGAELPPPPSVPNLDNLSDVEPAPTTAVPAPDGEVPATSLPGEAPAPTETTATTVPGGAPGTAVPAESTSTAPR